MNFPDHYIISFFTQLIYSMRVAYFFQVYYCSNRQLKIIVVMSIVHHTTELVVTNASKTQYSALFLVDLIWVSLIFGEICF